ncbi:piggyBac transposable element-derived protein 3-like [Portunus trituberculatus]|uniref:piggyBac transposable element-derived protein 3-like n=1 Tax=Portunus trituberculatus TaxID=210409 RepID=UPI001E1D1499|nr:piggyBac transposable element-derived protein 3-like [Portunus trituberculatus]
MILAEIPIYAQFKNEPDPAVTKAELKVFIAVLILSGYNRLPGKRFYWDSGPDMRNEMVHAAIRRDRFIQIMKFLHFADNNAMDSRDKLWKLRPLIKKLQNKFVKHFVPVPRLSYDESMIAYYGPHGCKQFIKGKPIRFGYKVWSLNTPSGYLVNFDVYQGKNVQINEDYEKQFGKAVTPLIQMIDSFDDDTKNLPFSLYFDNLFTGMELLSYLKQEGYNGTGTIRESRVPKECTIMPCKDMKKLERGTFTYKCSDDGILVARWQDTGSVTVATTVHSVNPVGHRSWSPSTSKASVSKGRLPDSIRYDGKNHYIIQNLGNKRRRCAGEYCKSVGRTACRDQQDELLRRLRKYSSVLSSVPGRTQLIEHNIDVLT